jgi:hypothetical protein
VTQPDDVGEPLWWVKRLWKQLQVQREAFELYDAYYKGQPKSLPWLPEQARREFARLLELTKSNYMGLVVDSMVERMAIEGFRIGDQPGADSATWDICQANGLDAGFDQVLLESAIGGAAFLMVAPNPDRADRPFITPEHPTQVTVEYEPGSGRRRRAAALKAWRDDWTGSTMATLQVGKLLYKFQAPGSRTSETVTDPRWKPREVRGETWPAQNPLGEVSIIEVENNPRMLTGGVSEIDDVIPVQDRIGKTIADRLMTQDFGAFPQKWAKGFPSEDADGNPTRIDIGRNRIVTSDAAETMFGQWDGAPLEPYSLAKREDVKDIASRTRTPAQYLLGEMSNVNGETLKASESGLVSKVRQRNRTAGQRIEDAITLARRAAGLGGEDQTIETIWRNPEFRTEGELVDALTKMSTLGVPQEALWERWGASQVEIARWKKMADEQAARDPLGQLTQAAGRGIPGDAPAVEE